ncbi:MAG: RNA polymerase sigma factor [Gemmataceae bacterium]
MENDSTANTRVSLLKRLRDQPEDHSAWDEFVDRYAPQLYAWCRQWRLQDADAQDITQNVLVKLAEKMRSFEYDATGSFRAWLKTVTRNAWNDFVKSQQRAVQGAGHQEVEELLGNVEASEHLVSHLESLFDLEVLELASSRVQARVDVQSWEAFRLTAREHVSSTQVAGRLNMTVSAVYKAKSRLLQMIREEVEKMEGQAS